MIRYALACENDHGFEAWFGSSADFDAQAARGLVECPFCASRKVGKQVMAPAVRTGRGKERSVMMETAARLRSHIADTFDDVGDAFAREARAIHEGESDDRPIYGQATPAEVRALEADGVPVSPLPEALTPRRKDAMN